MIVRRLLATVLILASAQIASAQFHLQHSGTTANLNSVDFWDNVEGWVVGDAGTVLHTLDSGKTWTKVEIGATTTLNAVAIDYLDFRAVNVVGASGKFYGTRDGITWYTSTIPGAPTLNAVDFPDVNVGYAAGANGALYSTIDSGHTWSKVSIPSTANFYGLYMYDDVTGWVFGAGGAAYYTDDAGATWYKDASTTADLRAMAYGDDTTAWIVGNKVIVKTTDDAVSFSVTPSTTDLRSVAALTAENAFAVGAGGKILVTTDGKNWQSGPSLTTANLNDIVAPEGDAMFIVGAQGTILSTIDPGSNAVIPRSAAPLALSLPFPNPASSEVTIPEVESGQTSIVLYDPLGRQLSASPLAEDLKLNVQDLPNGMYQYVLQTNGKISAIGKFTVMH